LRKTLFANLFFFTYPKTIPDQHRQHHETPTTLFAENFPHFFQNFSQALFRPPDKYLEGGNSLPLSLPGGIFLPVGSNLTSCECGGRL